MPVVFETEDGTIIRFHEGDLQIEFGGDVKTLMAMPTSVIHAGDVAEFIEWLQGERVRIKTQPPVEVKADDGDGWIKWEGGECPVPGEWRVDTLNRDGEITKNKLAFHDYWDWSGGRRDVVAYRLSDRQEAQHDE